MREFGVRRLVVVNDDRRVVGIVSLVDMPIGAPPTESQT
jgi:CBS domain-containing protein